MYNLNINLAQTAANAANNLLVETSGPTPRTPEILNSIVAMTNPLDMAFAEEAPKRVALGPPTSMSSDSNSSSSSQMESPTATNPPSVQQTCSQLIKAGLKLSIEQKRKHTSDVEDLLDLDRVKRIKRTESESEDDKIKQEHGLTPEDEERRRRRRERNKIAATKCRLKKRERTANLVTESETLEAQNIEMKSLLQKLQTQKRSLEDILGRHRGHCPHNIGPVPRDSYRLPPVSSVMDTNVFSRPSPNASTNYYEYGRDDGAPSADFQRSNFGKPPSIVVEEINDYDNQFTNLDDYNYNQQCHQNYQGAQAYGSQGLDNGCLA